MLDQGLLLIDADLTSEAGTLGIGIALLLLNVLLIIVIVLGSRETISRAAAVTHQAKRLTVAIKRRTSLFAQGTLRDELVSELRGVEMQSVTSADEVLGLEAGIEPMNAKGRISSIENPMYGNKDKDIQMRTSDPEPRSVSFDVDGSDESDMSRHTGPSKSVVEQGPGL